MKVSFIIAGFQKCGTTALFNFLSHHPKIISSNPKELDFFNYDVNYNKGFDFYHSHFKNKPIFNKYRGFRFIEASPSYVNDKDFKKTIDRLYQYNSNLKIIILVRNPIARAFSAWNMYRKRYLEGRTNWWFEWVEKRTGFPSNAIRRHPEEYDNFSLFVQRELECISNNTEIESGILRIGNYYKGIQASKDVFKKQILVMKNETMYSNTTDELKKISKFLNLPDYDWEQFEDVKIFKGDYKSKFNLSTMKILENYYYESNIKLFELTGIDYLN